MACILYTCAYVCIHKKSTYARLYQHTRKQTLEEKKKKKKLGMVLGTVSGTFIEKGLDCRLFTSFQVSRAFVMRTTVDGSTSTA